MNEYWCARIKARMKALKITQEKLAEKLDATQPAVNHWLNGRRELSIHQLEKIASCLDWTLEDVFKTNNNYSIADQSNREPLSVQEQKAIEYLRGLTKDQQAEQINIIKKRKEENESILANFNLRPETTERGK